MRRDKGGKRREGRKEGQEREIGGQGRESREKREVWGGERNSERWRKEERRGREHDRGRDRERLIHTTMCGDLGSNPSAGLASKLNWW